MALQVGMSDDCGNSYPNGYRRFSYLQVDVLAQAITAEFADYKDAAARQAGQRPFRVTRYRVTPDTTPSYAQFQAQDNTNPDGIAAQVYAFAKAQPGNVGATDV
jgi:hypothetical protein